MALFKYFNDSCTGRRLEKRGPYKDYTAEEKAKVAKRAAECGVTSTIRYFAAEFADRPLNSLRMGKTV